MHSCVEGWHNYTSGWVETSSNYNIKFGYIEARMKIPYRRGFWSAFWTWRGDGVPTSNEAEIDIFEMLGGLPSNTITTNVHTCYPNKDIVKVYGYDPNCIKPPLYQEHTFQNFTYTDWHTYAVEWDANKITWYLDGKIIRTLNNRYLDNHGRSIIDPIRIILGVAIDKDNLPPTSPPFTDYMYIDYVKVHKLKCDKNTIVNEIPNYNTFNYAVKKSISLSGVSSLSSGQNVSLRATHFIELEEGFEVPVGAELYLDINPCE